MSSNTEANKALVKAFYERVMNGHDFTNHSEFITDDFKSHRAERSLEGGENWINTFGHIIKSYMPDFKSEIKRIMAEGDEVWVYSEILNSGECVEGKRRMSVDRFHFKNGKIAEHWDIQQNVDPATYTV